MRVNRLQYMLLQSNKCRYYYGIGILDSLLALMFLAAVIAFFVVRQNTIMNAESAKQLADQTEAYAKLFTDYIQQNYAMLVNQTGNGTTVILSSQTLYNASDWPSDVSRQNLYQQTPCVGIVKNATTGNLDALLFYVGGDVGTNASEIRLVRNASMFLAMSGGILLDNQVIGNSGWSTTTASPFFVNASSCGGDSEEIANNSLAVNLNLLLAPGSHLQPTMAITKELDQSESNNILVLPGHLLNTNTVKANLNIANTESNGVILNNANSASPVELGVSYDQSDNATALGLGQNINNVVADTIKVEQQGYAGEPCLVQEIGKVIADAGISQGDVNQYLAYNTLVCTQNSVLCAPSSQCYLSSIKNEITFKNDAIGIQDTDGAFYCPAAIPFASNPHANGSATGVYYATNLGNQIGCYVANGFNIISCQYARYTVNNCQSQFPFLYEPGICGFSGAEIITFGQLGIEGQSTAYKFSNIGGLVTAVPASGSLNGYTVVTGYQLSVSPFNSQANCNNVCADLPLSGLSGNWVAATVNPAYSSPFNDQVSCGCYNRGATYYGMEVVYALAIVVLQSPNPKLTQVTCSNMPIYTVN